MGRQAQEADMLCAEKNINNKTNDQSNVFYSRMARCVRTFVKNVENNFENLPQTRNIDDKI